MLRVSTLNQFNAGVDNIVARQRELLVTMQQMSSGKRINGPADDPLGAADSTSIRSNLSQFAQFKSNQNHANYLLNMAESSLTGFTNGLQDIKEKLVAAGNGAYGDGERLMIAGELEGILSRLVGLANASDGAGGYLFAGSRLNAAPFSQSGNLVSSNGDEILQRLEVSQDRFQQVRYSGDALFNKIRPGNGSFTTAATTTNTGAAWIDAGNVVDPSALTGRPYTISFSVAGGVTSYSVERSNASGPATTVASGTYTSPATLQFEGVSVQVSGDPANGDSFAVAPAGFQSVFDSLAQAIEALKQPTAGMPAARARMQTALSGAQASMEGALDHILLKRADIGAGLQELDAYGALNDDRQLEFETRLSGVEDLDYAKATAELSRRQLSFQAALQSYSTVSKLSLFDYI
jgi:flagellar hook-associated protein 3 FlgL